jgi:isocitrate dehydrogenase
MRSNESKIDAELIAAQGNEQKIGGYYHPSFKLTEKAMRPSETLNNILSQLS